MAAQQPSSPGHSTTGPICATCARPKQLDKILVACIRCRRHYHPACHRPLPQDPFTCDACCRRAERKRLRLKAARNHHGIKCHSSSQTTASTPSVRASLSSATASSSSVTTSTTADTMYSSAGSPDNPFLPDNPDTGVCCEANCHEKALKPWRTCGQHFIATPPAEKSAGGSIRSLVSVVSPPSRKNLEGKTTARKSTARTPFLPAEARLNQPLSANNRLSNSYLTSKASHTRTPDASLPENPARKKQRVISPRDEDVVLNPGRSASPLAMPNGVLQGMQNGNVLSHTVPNQSAKLPTLSADLRSFSSAATDLNGRQRPVLSYGDYLKSPLTSGLNFGSELPKLNADVSSSTNHPHRTASTSSQKPPPTKVAPARMKPEQNEALSASPDSVLNDITRAPILEEQHQPSNHKKDTSSLDNFVYAQSLQSRPGGAPIVCSELKQQESVLYAALDPRSHRMRPHSEAWYQRKEDEIRARGGRKTNFGKAVHRMKLERLKLNGDGLEARLPDRVLQNENWVSAIRWFEDQSRGGASRTSATSSTPTKLKRPHKKRQPTSTSVSNEKPTGRQHFGD